MNRGQVDISQLSLLIVVPVLLVVGLLVFGIFEPTANKSFAKTYTNETFTPATGSFPTILTLSNTPMIRDSSTYTVSWYNATTGSLIKLTEGTNYTVQSYDTGKVNVTSVPNYNSINGDYISVDYDAVTGRGGSTMVTTAKNTYSGFDLASVLPIVIAAAIVLILVMGALRFRG